MLFNNLKKIPVQWSLVPILNIDNVSLGLFQNVEPINNYKKSFGCPAVSSIDNRMFYVNSPIDFTVDFGLKENGTPYYNYEFSSNYHGSTDKMHELLDEICHVEVNNNKMTFQLLLPYAFITDNDVELITLQPNLNTENTEYVNGCFNIKNWIRNVNSAWVLIDSTKPGKVHFDINKPIINYIFSKPINLNYKELNDKQLKYYMHIKGIVMLRKKISNIYNSIIKRRPKKLL